MAPPSHIRDNRDSIAEMIASGIPVSEIAMYYNVKYNLLLDYTRRNGMRTINKREAPLEPYKGEIRAMLRDGLKLSEIGRKLGLDEKRVNRYAISRGMREPKQPAAASRHFIKAMLAEGLLPKQIAYRLGRSEMTITRVIRDYKLRPAPNYVGPHHEKIIIFAVQGRPITWIANKLGVKRDSLRVFMRRNGIVVKSK